MNTLLGERAEPLQAFYLPGCSLERNPGERLNAGLRRVVGSKAPGRTKAGLREVTDERMTQLARQPERVRACFRDPRIE